jgi:hypothetical protein
VDNVVGTDPTQAFLYTTFPQPVLDLRGNVDERPSGWYFTPELLVIDFHILLLSVVFKHFAIMAQKKPGTTRVAPGFFTILRLVSDSAYSDLSEAISMEKRYLTSLFSIRS